MNTPHMLNFSTASAEFEQASSGLMVLPVFNTKKGIETITASDNFQSWLTALGTNENFKAKSGETLLVLPPHQPDGKWERLLLVGMGDKKKLDQRKYMKSLGAIRPHLLNTAANNTTIGLPTVDVVDANPEDICRQTARLIQAFFYEYQHPSRGKHHKPTKRNLKTANVMGHASLSDDALNQCLQQGSATAIGMALTKDTANLPGNYCTPAHIADVAEELGKQAHTKTTVLELETCKDMGMGSFYSVAKGSTVPAKFVIVEYKHPKAKNNKPIALVGKGVTFDTGGISLKPGTDMDEMKYDMCGAATVLGVLKTVQMLSLPLHLACVMPATENMPAGNASKPGDVVTSLSGQTIEVLNTDAEGRLILCDALTYVQREYKPKVILDMATLTGACIIALGNDTSAILGNDDSLCQELVAAGSSASDDIWQLPLNAGYDEMLKSNFADMANISPGRGAGTITAAAFLGRFIENDTPWAHLDIAGTAWVSGKEKGATGRPVPLLMNYLLQQAK